MRLNKATGEVNRQLTDACSALSLIDKSPKIFNSYDFRRAIKILFKLYATTRKKHNPDLIKWCLIRNGMNEDWASDFALIWETLCTIKEELRK